MANCDAVNHSANRRIVVVIVLIAVVAPFSRSRTGTVQLAFASAIAIAIAVAMAITNGCQPWRAFIMPKQELRTQLQTGYCGRSRLGPMNEKFSENFYAWHNCCCDGIGIAVAGRAQIKSTLHRRTKRKCKNGTKLPNEPGSRLAGCGSHDHCPASMIAKM
ncbi:hypothetical protein AWZ03_003868 [Drosophila navojoa]|uniref:Uncharacterized protein n=1 Tax=Drosophila navojoa TaxID=7232 RepID=A0A484BNL1_DRONA|nr:hypothetical protein AWZ03_003868 [Drosophila navojoa]